MMKFGSIFRCLADPAALCLLFLAACGMCSCDPVISSDDDVFEVSVKSFTVTSEKGQQFVNVRCKGAWTLSLTADEGDAGWASLSVAEGTGDKSNVILSYDKNDTGFTRELKIVLDNGRLKSECAVVQSAAEEDSDPVPPVEDEMDFSKIAWMELPATDNPDLGYYSHSFTMDGKRYRNYTFGWSQEDRVALWIAYPLCGLYTNGSAGRTNEWALDPILKENSAAPFGGYAGDYARGHQVPSADRQCSYEANAQTFYGTNITPQLNAHNEGIWSNLESRVRTYANSADTLYVVTGVVVSPSGKKERDSFGNSVTVPDAYFKALLKFSKNSTFGVWNAAAFYLEHRNYSGGVLPSHSMSIDRLEEMTGIDFFVNLPAMIGEKAAMDVEAADPSMNNIWW